MCWGGLGVLSLIPASCDLGSSSTIWEESWGDHVLGCYRSRPDFSLTQVRSITDAVDGR